MICAYQNYLVATVSYASGRMSAVQAWWAVTGIVAVAFATPGPNNLAVLAAASRGGFIRAAPTAAGVIAGTVALVIVSWAGAGLVFERIPAARSGLAVAGGLYFAWLGVQLLRSNEAAEDGSVSRSLSFAAMFLLQFVNPKAWLLVLAVTVIAHGSVTNLAVLVSIMSAVSLVCLSLWAAMGRIIGVLLQGSAARLWVDRILGALLIGLAGLTLAQGASGIDGHLVSHHR
ncbi:MAG: LysE family translocator [Alphaproteobacteria bacterium]|nr:LysE family translocator [Alphaproteobacteria bacterium]